MKSPVRFHAVACAAALLLVPWQGFATDPTSKNSVNCDSVAEAVRSAVEKEPQKVLVFVEDFMVSNEGCAAAIVKAAIEASKANADLARQIAVTATHVAPPMGPVIAEAVSKLIPDQAPVIVAATQKEEGLPSGVGIPSDAIESGPSDDNLKLPSDVRGVYFIEPLAAGGGAVTQSQTSSHSSKNEDSDQNDNKSKGKDKSANSHQDSHKDFRRPPNHPPPVSPSSGIP